MGVWGRAVHTLNTAWAAWQSYQPHALAPDGVGWGEIEARRARYTLYDALYHNRAYHTLHAQSAALKEQERLYRHTRGIYNPVARQNDLLVAYLAGGALDTDTLTQGAIPLQFDNAALVPALQQVYTWSRLAELKSLYVRQLALYGDVALKVVDEPHTGKVRIEVIPPSRIKHLTFDAVGNVKAVTIEYDRAEDAAHTAVRAVTTRDTYRYTEIIDGTTFRTFKDGEPFAYYTNNRGQPVAEWVNPYGFVPLVWVNWKASGNGYFGLNAFHNALTKIHEVNDAASLLNDQIRKSVNVVWLFTGTAKQGELSLSADKRDSTPYLTLPAGSDAKPLLASLPIAEVSANIAAMLHELERDLPELALQRIREGGGLTAPGVRAGYSDAEGRIQEGRAVAYGGLLRALQMAVSIGGFRGYTGFEAFTLDSYARGDMRLAVRERPVIADTLTVLERVNVLATLKDVPPALQRLMLQALGYPDAEIEGVLRAAAAPAAASLPALTPDGLPAFADTLRRAGLDGLLDEDTPNA